VYTLPALLGVSAARLVAVCIMLGQYAIVLLQIWQGYFQIWTLGLVLLGLPVLIRSIAVFRADPPKERPKEIPAEIWPLYYVAYAFAHNRVFSALYVLGLCLDTVYIRFSP
jgi:1,4-dihydroxy-2-naphthoate octaprenyltransferase